MENLPKQVFHWKSSSGNSGKSKSSSSSKDSEQDVDYIEIKFKRLERVISNFGKIASDTFRSLGNRLDHLTKIAGNKKYDSELELLKSEKILQLKLSVII